MVACQCHPTFLSVCILSKSYSYPKYGLNSTSYWTDTYSPAYGTCYTFNSATNPNATEVFTASLTGVSNGLSIEVFIDQSNYMIKKLSKR